MANNQTLLIESSLFKNNEYLPAKFTCDGEKINPEIMISNIPTTAKTLALIMEDPDAPSGTFIHWVKWNISVSGSSFEIKEGQEPVGTSGLGTSASLKYVSPCPPSGTHRYILNVYALDAQIDLRQGSSAGDLMNSIKDHVQASGKLTGLYNRIK